MERPSRRLGHKGYQRVPDGQRNGGVSWRKEWQRERGGSNVPSIVPPLSIFLRIESVRDFLIDSDHDVGLVRSKAEDRERTRERADRFLKRCGSWPFNVPGEPGRLFTSRDL